MANKYYNLLSKDQIDNIEKNRKRQLGKYYAMWAESGHLNTFMITLSPVINTMSATLNLRKHFFKQLNYVKGKNGYKIAYFSAIEIKINKNPPGMSAQITQQTRMKLMQKNFHIHIQILTNMKKSDLKTFLNQKIYTALCTYHNLSIPQKQGIKYDYVVKDIKNIDWKLQYILKTQYKNKVLYTSSRKEEFTDHMIKKLWSFMKKQYKNKWNKIGDKFSFILALKKNGDLLLSSTGNVGSNLCSVNLSLYDVIHIQNMGIYIYVKKNVL